MLRELSKLRQIPGEPRRRWFASKKIDLIAWFGESDQLIGFQFCYDKESTEQSLTWWSHSGFSHAGVDDGENGGRLRYKASPVLMIDSSFDTAYVLALFAQSCENVPIDIAGIVNAKIKEYGDSVQRPSHQLQRAAEDFPFAERRIQVRAQRIPYLLRRAEDRPQ